MRSQASRACRVVGPRRRPPRRPRRRAPRHADSIGVAATEQWQRRRGDVVGAVPRSCDGPAALCRRRRRGAAGRAEPVGAGEQVRCGPRTCACFLAGSLRRALPPPRRRRPRRTRGSRRAGALRAALPPAHVHALEAGSLRPVLPLRFAAAVGRAEPVGAGEPVRPVLRSAPMCLLFRPARHAMPRFAAYAAAPSAAQSPWEPVSRCAPRCAPRTCACSCLGPAPRDALPAHALAFGPSAPRYAVVNCIAPQQRTPRMPLLLALARRAVRWCVLILSFRCTTNIVVYNTPGGAEKAATYTRRRRRRRRRGACASCLLYTSPSPRD